MAYDVAQAFKRIEDELIDSMMRNLGRHNAEEALEGFDWTQWQVEQLRSLEDYRKKNQKKYGPEFEKINKRIGKSIERMGAKGENDQEKAILRALDKGHVPPITREGNLEGTFFGVNNLKLDALLDATQNDFQKAEWAVLRRADDQYRRIIFDAQVYANTGAATYGKAIDMATKDFLMRGIDCIEYKNGARHTISDYADMYVKTAQTRAYLAGEGKMREEWGEHYVIVNKRGDVTCPKCAKWVGRVLIDDVYSGGKPDGKTPLLSTAMADGFLHPRCKDIFTTYFPGISTPPEPATKEEIRHAEKVEKAEARQDTAVLMQEKWERRAKYQIDPADRRMCKAHANEWAEEADLVEAGRLRSIQKKQASREKLGRLLNGAITIGKPYINPKEIVSKSFRSKFSRITNNSNVNQKLRSLARANLTVNNGTYTEMLHIIDADTGQVILQKVGARNALEVALTAEERSLIRDYRGNLIGLHNHPTNIFPTGSDFVAAGSRGYEFGLVITHDLRVFKYTPPRVPIDAETLDLIIDKYTRLLYDDNEKRRGFERAMQELERRFGITWKEM